jgi:tripartite-type tricarboxylate transporter receptor subunit TctC
MSWPRNKAASKTGAARRWVLSAGLCLAAAIAFSAAAYAQPAASFYKGKQITMLVASGAGGGYDTYARTLARHMTKHIAGNPVIVPKNLPGAGGLVGASTLYNNSPPDGLTFAALTNGIAMDPLFKKYPGRFDPLKFAWLGSIGKLMNVCVTWHTSPVKTIQQAQQHQVIVSASGATSNSVMMPKITNTLLGTKFKVVTGYADSDVTLAMERGEVEGVCGLSYTTLKATRPEWFRDRKINILLQIGLAKFPDLPNVPSAIDLIPKQESRKVLELILIRQEMGRPFAAPPGVPADRVQMLRQAFDATLKDPEFLADAKKLQMEVDPLPGAEIERLLKQAYSTPPAIVAQAAALVP